MGIIESTAGFSGFTRKAENFLESNFPNMLGHVDGIAIGKNRDSAKGLRTNFKIGPNMQSRGMYMSQDSLAGVKRYVANEVKPGLRIENSAEFARFVAGKEQAYAAKGMSQDSITEAVRKDITSYMTFDSATGQYVIKPIVAKVNDSIISNATLPYWNIGFLNRVFKQPYAKSFAGNLVSKESFGNPWADTLMVYKAAFEGYGRISNVARGTVETNNSNPITSEYGVIATDVINLAIDYDSNTEEMLRAGNGNPLSGQAFGDRERYADMMLRRLHDALIIFGNPETGTDGLTTLATGGVVAYTGTPLDAIVNGVDTNKGALIVDAVNELIQEFLRENRYMAREIKINCSTYVMKAMLSTKYSDQFNPSSPMEIIRGRFDAAKDLGGGLSTVNWSMVADPMLDPHTPFNTSANDLFIITVPSIDSDLDGGADGLVIAPVPLEQFIVPPMYQRSGLLYTMYKRVGGIIAPVENTIRVWAGFGKQA